MQNVFFLFFCLAIGIGLKQFRVLKDESHLVLNNLLLYVCLPAATILHTSETRFESAFLLPILMPWILFIASLVFFQILDRFYHFERQTKAVLILTAGIPSVSFIGFPVLEMLYGKSGLEIGILMSQSGSFLVCSTLGIAVASYYAASKTDYVAIALNVFKFPTFIAFVIAIVINLMAFHLPDSLKNILQKLASPFTFLALISVGMQIPFKKENWQVQPLQFGLGFKLLIAPILILVLYQFVFKAKGIIFEASVVAAALGPMNTIAIIAAKYRLNPPLAAQMVGIGIPLSFVSTFIFYYLIR
jgi:malate permease and related proteins